MKTENLPLNAAAEIAELKEQVAVLRQQMKELKQFIRYQPPGEDDDGKPQAAYLDLQCTFFRLVHPSDQSYAPVRMMCHPDGSFISICAKNEKARIVMSMEKEVPELSLHGTDGKCKARMYLDEGEPRLDLYGPEDKVGVQIRVQGEAGRGVMGVCEAGKPRAGMRATEFGGAVSAVYDDGHSRITMVSTEDNGELLAISQDMKTGVKISANGPDGGFLTVNHQNGKAGVILATTALSGGIILNDPQGNVVAMLPGPE